MGKTLNDFGGPASLGAQLQEAVLSSSDLCCSTHQKGMPHEHRSFASHMRLSPVTSHGQATESKAVPRSPKHWATPERDPFQQQAPVFKLERVRNDGAGTTVVRRRRTINRRLWKPCQVFPRQEKPRRAPPGRLSQVTLPPSWTTLGAKLYSKFTGHGHRPD